MNLQEFAALKVGDKIQNLMNGGSAGHGEVVDVESSGVRVRWGAHSQPFFYSVVGTSWFHWSKADDNCACGGGDISGHAVGCPEGRK